MEKTIPFSVRQGDVLLVKVSGLPEEEVTPSARGPQILARGETTGHAHYVAEREGIQISPSKKLAMIAAEFGIQDVRSIIGGLRVTVEQATLWHGTPTDAPAGPTDSDHRALVLPVGDYVVIQARQYESDEDFVRVAD